VLIFAPAKVALFAKSNFLSSKNVHVLLTGDEITSKRVGGNEHPTKIYDRKKTLNTHRKCGVIRFKFIFFTKKNRSGTKTRPKQGRQNCFLIPSAFLTLPAPTPYTGHTISSQPAFFKTTITHVSNSNVLPNCPFALPAPGCPCSSGPVQRSEKRQKQ